MKRRPCCSSVLLILLIAVPAFLVGMRLLGVSLPNWLPGRPVAAIPPALQSVPAFPNNSTTPADPNQPAAPADTNQAANGEPLSSGYPRIVTDARGKSITLRTAPVHIVSLMPSLTEIVYALKLGDRLAADTLSCDYPPEAASKPHVDPLSGDREKIEVVAPDLVLCIDKLNSTQLIDALEKDGVQVFVVKANTLLETYEAIRLIGQATSREQVAAEIIQAMQSRIEAVQRAVSADQDKPGVVILYSDNPLYTTGPDSYISDVIKAAGGENIVNETLPNNIISPEKVVERQPEVMICDQQLIPKLKLLPGWNVVPAIMQNRFFKTSRNTTLVRPSPRLAIAVEELARYLHPDLMKNYQNYQSNQKR